MTMSDDADALFFRAVDRDRQRAMPARRTSAGGEFRKVTGTADYFVGVAPLMTVSGSTSVEALARTISSFSASAVGT